MKPNTFAKSAFCCFALAGVLALSAWAQDTPQNTPQQARISVDAVLALRSF